MIERAREWWRARAPRERLVYGLGAGALVAASLWAYVWLPVQGDRARLATAVPKLRAQAAETTRESAEVEHLRAAARGRGAVPQGAIEDAMKAAGFGDAYGGVSSLGESRGVAVESATLKTAVCGGRL